MVSEDGHDKNGDDGPERRQRGAAEDAGPTPDTGQVLLFVVQELLLCVELARVVKMLPLTALRPVPLGPPYLVGLMNLGGKSTPVIDLGVRMGLMNGQRYRLDTPILLMTDGHRTAGLIVSEAIGVADAKDRGRQLDSMFGQERVMFNGVVNTDHGQALVLDTARALVVDFSGEVGEAGLDAAFAGGGESTP